MIVVVNSYQTFVTSLVQAIEAASQLSLSTLPLPPSPVAWEPDAPTVLIFSPHPDDECIVGGLPLRLLRELRWRVVNVAVTQGSNRSRQAERYQELLNACRYLNFEVQSTGPHGLENIKASERDAITSHWQTAIGAIAALLQQYQPRVVCFPHERDWNSTHIGTHYLVMDALATLGDDFSCYVVETEFWGAMENPNLIIESSAADVADLVTALACHVGEVQRNPYHLRQPAWMMDNVRRGGELVGGQGEAVPSDWMFATLYRLRRWHQGAIAAVALPQRLFSKTDSLATLFEA